VQSTAKKYNTTYRNGAYILATERIMAKMVWKQSVIS
jgi:glutamate dehydrogenase/leucine dehydrogenase